MSHIRNEIRRNHKYLSLLAQEYPSIQSVCTEIINLRAILNLPKGTEHFMSDLHGEYEAFTHILNNCSGVIKDKVEDLFADTLSDCERAQLCTLIYYPEEKLRQMRQERAISDGWYERMLLQMLEVCRVIASKYTRSKVRKALPEDFAYIIDELLHADYEGENQSLYYSKIMESILALHNADGFIVALAGLIKRLAVDRLHIVGDLFDRGPRPDRILDLLRRHHSVDIQWGNHDILWMGAAAGSSVCAATVVNNCAAFGNLTVLEQGYGINLRPLALFAEKTYRESPCFAPRSNPEITLDESVRNGKIYKAAAILQLKLEGQTILRHPEYGMEDRLLLEQIDFQQGTVQIGEKPYPLRDRELPTVWPDDPYALTDEELELVEGLVRSFRESEKLQAHAGFLYTHGSIYRSHNQNLLFHGCIPMEEDGGFTPVDLDGRVVSGKALMDRADAMARRAFYAADDQNARDGMWYLWCGKHSPLFGRDKMTTFERLFVEDQSTWAEEKNCYYSHVEQREQCTRILEEFGLFTHLSHIVNGHVPVRAAEGESPVKGGGRLIVIDGGFCKAYHRRTGIAGYTLIYNSYGMRLSAHHPFESLESAIRSNADIHSSTEVFETLEQRLKVMDTDTGQGISERIYDLSLLLHAYRNGGLDAYFQL